MDHLKDVMLKRWLGSQGKLYLISDTSGILMKVLLPIAWGLAFPSMSQTARILWIVLAALYFVHDLTLSSAVRRDPARKPVHVTTVDGVRLSREDAQRVREIIDEARAKQSDEPMQ